MWDWDEKKRAQTLDRRGLDFEVVRRFDLTTALVEPDDRRDYGEIRLRAIGLIDGRLHVIVFSPRGDCLRLISLRRANERERLKWLPSAL
jgi:uncharacterized protein